jgi:hypothetical protein
MTLVVLAGCGVAPASAPAPAALTAPPVETTAIASPTVPPPSPSAKSQPPIPTPVPAAVPTAEAVWRQLATSIGGLEFDPEEDGWVSAAGFADGYVLLIEDSPYPDAFTDSLQVSSDGATWASALLPHVHKGRAGASAVASDGQRVVAVGTYSVCTRYFEENPPDKCRYRPMSWVSDDGRTWRRARAWAPALDSNAWGSVFASVWASPSGGWDAAQASLASEEDYGVVGSVVWHSEDGLIWSRVPDLSAMPPDDHVASPVPAIDGAEPYAVASGPAGLLAFAQDGNGIGVWTQEQAP